MVGKSKKKKEKNKKDKKSKKAKGSHIASAIMPVAMFAAVPRTPPPPKDPPIYGPGPGLSSAVFGLGSAMRLFGTPEPPQEPHMMSDTDTSLFDYDNPDFHPGYASLEGMREGPSGESLAAHRGRPSVVYEDVRDYEDEDDYMSDGDLRGGSTFEAMAVIHEQALRSDYPEYAQVNRAKKKKKKPLSDDSDMTRVSTPDDLLPPSTSMRRFLEEDARATGGRTSPPRAKTPTTPRRHSPSPGLRRRTPSPDTVDRGGAQMLSMEYSASLMSSAPQPQFPTDDLLHTTSPKLAALEKQNQDLLVRVEEQQQILQKQQQMLLQQQQQQQEVLDRLRSQDVNETQNPGETIQEMGTLLNSTQSVTDATMRHQDDLIKSLKDRSKVLDEEKRELRDLNEQLQAEINSLRRMASFRDSGEGEEMGTQVMLLKKQLQDFKDERDTLKATVQRLNVELSRYQGKYRPPSADQGDLLGLPTKGPVPSWLINTKYLAPLFVAYDDRMAEKDQVIRHYEEELSGFREQVEDIVKENQRLHLRIEQTDVSGPMSMTEWRQLQEQCKLVLEENQLLMEQHEVQQKKAREMQRNHALEISQLSKKMVNVEAEKMQMESEVEELRMRWAAIKHKYETSLLDSHSQVNVEEHVNAIHELKRSQEDERQKAEHEFDNIKTKMHSLQSERKAFALQVEDLKVENKQLEEEIRLMHKANRKSERKCLLLQRVLAEVESKEQSASQYLSNVVKVAEKTAVERDTFAQVAQKQEKQKNKAINKLLEGTVAQEKMEEKLKVYKLRLVDKLQKSQSRMKAQDEDFNNQRGEYEREIRHLRLLLKEREELLEVVSGDKKNIEDDLETMWQVATSDNRRMKETMRKSIRKLKEHAGINAVLSEEIEIDNEITMDILNSEKC